MITNVSRREDDRLTWKDIELLPLYGGIFVLGILAIRNFDQLGPALQDGAVKAGLVMGLLGVQRWLGIDVGASD